ncbi:MAG: ectoine synthase [Myxococcota bacterium]
MRIVRTRDLEGTGRQVVSEGWSSKRLLLRRDGLGFSLHETVVAPGAVHRMWYKHHLEAVFCVGGDGSVEDLATGEVHRLEDGVAFAVDQHERHVLRGGSEPMRLVCVFNPPIAGREQHDPEGSYDELKRQVFIIGLDDFNLQKARAITDADETEFHGLLDYDDLITPESYDFQGMVDEALRELRAFEGPVDAIIAHWDFPVSTMVPILNREMGLPYVPLVSMLKCEHKYWSRVEQKKVLPELVPQFDAVDPFDDQALERLRVDFPFWLKPVKSFASYLGFRVEDEAQFREAIAEIRENIRRIGDPFNVVMDYVDLPPDIAAVDGNWCVAEELMSGWQCGVEGYVLHGQTRVHGIFDCYKDRNGWSFNRYEYPSRWPRRVQQRMIDAVGRLMPHLGYNSAPFGVEFFWDEARDKLWLIEVNTRISQSHSDQFEKVHGISNHEIAINVALGLRTRVPRPRGAFQCAAKFHLRRYADAVVEQVPDEANLAAVARAIPGTEVHVTVEPGARLSDLRDQDSFSYEIATVHLGAEDQAELLARFRECAEMLDFRFSDGGRPEDVQFLDPVSWE